jgi:predicted nucleic acid-binding protein
LDAAGQEHASRAFESLHGELLLGGIDGLLARRAGELAEQLGLRGYDAVHLASALALGTDTTFVSWDDEPRRAAARSGCAVAPAV